MIVSLQEAVERREAMRGKGTVAVANGAFDLLHVGHVRYLQSAKAMAKLLIVGVNSDVSVQTSKGPKRPIVPEKERAELVDALRCVDLVVLFDEQTAEELLKALKPDLHVKGTDYTAESVPEKALVQSLGGRTVIAGDAKEHSTTDVIARIRELC